jgi:hypothetical protein
MPKICQKLVIFFNYVFLGLEPSRDIKESDDWKSIEPYCIKERENATLKYGRL